MITKQLADFEQTAFNNKTTIITDDKEVKSIYGTLIENRFNNKYTRRIVDMFQSKDCILFGDKRLGDSIKGSAIYDGKYKVNLGEFITKENPMGGVSQIRNIYSILMKAHFRKYIKGNNSIYTAQMLTASALLFLSQFKAFIYKYGNYKPDTQLEHAELEALIVLNFVTILVKRNVAFAKITAQKILTEIYKYERVDFQTNVIVERAIQNGNVYLNWEDFFDYLNEEKVEKTITTKGLVAYYLIMYPMTVFGLDDYEKYIGDTYSYLAANAYTAKFVFKRFPNECNDFVKVFESIV